MMTPHTGRQAAAPAGPCRSSVALTPFLRAIVVYGELRNAMVIYVCVCVCMSQKARRSVVKRLVAQFVCLKGQ